VSPESEPKRTSIRSLHHSLFYEYMAVIALTCSPGCTRSEESVSASVFKSQGESNDERVCRIGRVS
jgi:hypothetical protein